MNGIKKIIYIAFMLVAFQIAIFSHVSIAGPTGFLNVPSPQTVEPNTFEGGAHFSSYSFGGNTNYNIWSIKGNVGVAENIEVGFEKTSDSGTLIRDPGMRINAKGAWGLNNDIKFATGIIVDTTSGNGSSVYGVFGADVAFFGMGFNFGADSGLPFSTAPMGGYDLTDIEPDKVFFLAGAKFEFGDSGSLSVSYNGDAVGIGFLAQIEEEEGIQSSVELGWVVEGDYEDLYKKYINNKYEKKRMIFGISGKW
ncbi:MAG: hypothetical protein ACOCWO_00205 [Candidatus Muiribacteriaceae bacterium]